MAYASGKFSKAQCDRCGFVYKYPELKTEWNGLKTCPTCYEIKHPQLEPLRHVIDPEALREARPTESAPTTGLGRVFSSNPVDSQGVSGIALNGLANNDPIGSEFDMKKLTGSLGEVSVVIT